MHEHIEARNIAKHYDSKTDAQHLQPTVEHVYKKALRVTIKTWKSCEVCCSRDEKLQYNPQNKEHFRSQRN